MYVARESPLMEHLKELAVRLRRIAIAILVSAAVLSVVPVAALDALSSGDPSKLFSLEEQYVPLVSVVPKKVVEVVVPKSIVTFGRTYNITIMPTSPAESFNLLFYTVMLLGVLGASPVIAREVWAYIEPALYPHEKKFVKWAVAAGLAFFAFGVWLGLFVIAPWTMRITLAVYPFFVPEGYSALLRVSVSEVFEFAVLLSIATGLVFEVPPIIYTLLSLGVLDPEMFSGDGLRWAFVAAMIVGAIISPDPTGLGMILLGTALYAPFYASVKLGIRAYNKRKELERRGEVLAREELELLYKLAAQSQPEPGKELLEAQHARKQLPRKSPAG